MTARRHTKSWLGLGIRACPAEVQRYTRAANQLRLARKAIERSDNKDVTNLRRKGD